METKTYTKEELDEMPRDIVLNLVIKNKVSIEYIQNMLIEISKSPNMRGRIVDFIVLIKALPIEIQNATIFKLLAGNKRAKDQVLDYFDFINNPKRIKNGNNTWRN